MTVQSVCKNTFISFVVECEFAGDTIPASLMSASKCAPRSRSAECVRCREGAALMQEQAQQSLHRLDAVLSVGMSTREKENPKVVDTSELSLKTETLSELALLQAKLSKALGQVSPSSPPQSPLKKPWGDRMRIASNCSLSTMAPDDASDVASLPDDSPRMGMRKMPHVWSSSSVNTMVSDLDFVDEDGEVEFELDIEAAAEAAKPKSTTRWSDMEVDAEAEVPTSTTAPRRKVSPEMSHGQVPKNQNMEEKFASSNEPITTMMIRNIPGRYSQDDLMLDLKELGFAGTYDFLYMPMDKGTSANVGYGFVNFVHPCWAEKCLQSFQTFRFQRHQRSLNKWAKVSVAHLQGLEKNMKHYENAAVNVCKEKRGRPVVFANIAKMF